MGMKKVFQSKSVNNRSFRVMYDSEWEEYRVKFYSNSAHEIECDYHTGDREDAIDTGTAWLMDGIKIGSNINVGVNHD